LSSQSKLILHGSVATNGYKLLSDDCIQLKKINSQYFIKPSHPSIRLWADSKLHF